MKMKVLLVEDEQTLAMIIKDTLTDQGFEVVWAADGLEGLKSYFAQKPDVLIADIMMPKMDGFELVEKIRQSDKYLPILFLTARSAIKDVVAGFELGANDYLKKPFNMQELIVRIKALVNRAFVESKESDRFEIGDYIFDSMNQKLLYSGLEQQLSHRESEILKRLCINRNNVVDTKNILLDLWGDDSFFNSRSLHVFITKLRAKLSKDDRIRIINVRGIGYKLLSEYI
jgi:DNA-binding response OmpR family regulator